MISLLLSYRGTEQPTQRSNLCQQHKLKKNDDIIYDIIHDIIIYISDMAYIYIYIYMILYMISIYAVGINWNAESAA